MKASRNRLIADNEVRAHSLHRTARLRLGISAKELFIERADLHFGESRPGFGLTNLVSMKNPLICDWLKSIGAVGASYDGRGEGL